MMLFICVVDTYCLYCLMRVIVLRILIMCFDNAVDTKIDTNIDTMFATDVDAVIAAVVNTHIENIIHAVVKDLGISLVFFAAQVLFSS